jgi:large subunit ribosomal protein L41
MFRSTLTLLGPRRWTALSSKQANKNFYKGRGAPSAGRHAKRGGQYIAEPRKVFNETFVAPDLEGFKLKAYVSPETPEL